MDGWGKVRKISRFFIIFYAAYSYIKTLYFCVYDDEHKETLRWISLRLDICVLAVNTFSQVLLFVAFSSSAEWKEH